MRVYQYYATRAAQVARGVVLKTDAFNECGLRWWAVPIIDKLTAERIVVVEKDGARAAICRERFPGVEVVTQDLTKQEFPPKLFDTILDLSTIDHVEDWEKVIDNYGSWLKPGGKLLLFAWVGEKFEDLGQRGMDREYTLDRWSLEAKLRTYFSVEIVGSALGQERRELMEYLCEAI